MRSNALQQITLPDLNGGLNTHDPEYDIADNQSPDMLNLWYKDMALCKRPGQTWLSQHANVYRVSEPYNGARVVHAGTKLYRWNTEGMKRHIGQFDPSAGYPLGARHGDYATAAESGTLRGVTYEAGDPALYGGVQAVSVTIAGMVTASGTAKVMLSGAAFPDKKLVLEVAVLTDDTAVGAAGRIRAALELQTLVSAAYTVGGEGAVVTLTQAEVGAQDEILGIAVENGSCKGLEKTGSADASVWGRAVAEVVMEKETDAIQDGPGVFCEFGDVLYYMDGEQIWQIYVDNGVFKAKAVKPYVPVVMMNATPVLDGSTDNEPYNLIGSEFTVWYNGTGGSQLSYYVKRIDANTFTLKATKESVSAVNITTTGIDGWKIRRVGSYWSASTPTVDTTTDRITLAAHGLVDDDAVQFDTCTGRLPGGISAYDAVAKWVYQLPQKHLDNTTVKASVNAENDLVEGVHFTVDRENGTVNFLDGTSPYGIPAKGTNNVWITASKTAFEADEVTPKKKRITGCRAAVRFGGETAGVTGGTRVFVMANPAFPLCYWRSDLGLHISAGMGYFPDTSEEVLDQNSDAITAAAKMGSELIIFKENSIFAVGYSFDGQDVYYPVRECHSAIGCDMPGSVQLIDNRLVFAHSKGGVYMLASSNNDLENIVKPISANINSLLLAEKDLKGASSCDYDRYYWLCANGRVYLWDYDTTPYYNYADYDKAQKRLAWYRFDNIRATDFFEDGGLCYGGENGIVKFAKSRNDFGEAINAWFKSKAFDLGSPEDEKTFVNLYPSFSMDGNILVRVTAGNERMDVFRTAEFDIRSFDWSDFNWSAFTWNRIKYAKTFAMRLNMRRAAFLQVKVSGSEIDRGVGLSGLRVTYYVNRKMKR